VFTFIKIAQFIPKYKIFALFVLNRPEECSAADGVGLNAATMSSTLWSLV